MVVMKGQPGNRKIQDFFKPFTVPRNGIPRRDIEEDITVASSSTRSDSLLPKPNSNGASQGRSIPVVLPSPTSRGRNGPSESVTEGNASAYSNTPTPTKRRPGRPRKQTSQTDNDAIYNAPQRRTHSPTGRIRPRKVTQYDDVDEPSSSSLSPVPSSDFFSFQYTRNASNAPLTQSTDPPEQLVMAPPVEQPMERPSPKRPQEAKPANTSFGSFSTLSSVPISSQSSSKRVVKNGIQGVTNSDSGSQENSEDELTDVDSFLRSKRRKITSSPPPTGGNGNKQNSADSDASKTRSTRSSDVPRKRPRSPQTPPKRAYKHSLLNMVKQNAKDREAKEAISQAEASVQQAGKWREDEAAQVDENEGLSMAVAMAEDSDAGERMRNAMARTEALREDDVFYFFQGTQPVTPRSPFPVHALPEQGWMRMLEDETEREEAVMSGFVGEASASQPLPQPIVDWMTRELAYERKEELCEAYVDIIRACTISHGFETTALSSLDGFYDALPLNGAGGAATEGGRKVARLLPRGVRHVIQAVRYYIEGRDQESTANTLFAFALLNIDDNVKHDVDIQLVLHSNMDGLLEAVSGSVLQAVYAAVRDKVFGCAQISNLVRLRLINALPATSTRLYELRRTLALRCFNSDLIASAETAVSSALFTTLLTHIRSSPEWSISDSTDYTILHAVTDVLSLAMPAGFTPSSTLLALPTPKSPSHPESIKKSSLFADSTSAESAQSDKEKDFNTRLDALVSQLRSISSRIKDAGTSNLKRTEAKAAMERLIVVLEVSVRTKVKRRRGVFDDGGQDRGAIEAFLGLTGVAEM